MNIVINFDEIASKLRLYDILKLLKGKYLIKIERYAKKRSTKQNNYYWGVVLKYLSETTGYSVHEMHEVCKLKFNPYEKANKKTGEITVFGGSTTELNTIQEEEYLENIRRWAIVDLDCLIPLPNEVIN